MLSELTSPAAMPASPQPTEASAPSFDLSSVPVLQRIAEADEPGFLATDEDLKRPELAPAVANYKALAGAGLSLYRSQSGPIAVFNQDVFSGEEIQQFDARGILNQVLPPVSQLLDAVSKTQGDVKTEAAAQPPPPSAPAKAPASPAPIVRARANATAMPNKQPTRRPNPGSGSVSQGLGKPVI